MKKEFRQMWKKGHNLKKILLKFLISESVVLQISNYKSLSQKGQKHLMEYYQDESISNYQQEPRISMNYYIEEQEKPSEKKIIQEKSSQNQMMQEQSSLNQIIDKKYSQEKVIEQKSIQHQKQEQFKTTKVSKLLTQNETSLDRGHFQSQMQKPQKDSSFQNEKREEMQVQIAEQTIEKKPKKRLTLGLFTKNSKAKGFIDDYLEDKFIEDETKRNKREKKVDVKKTRQKMKHIQQNPQEYFNFNFSLADYQRFLALLIHKRVQRQQIQEKTIAVLEQSKKKKKQICENEDPYVTYYPK